MATMATMSAAEYQTFARHDFYTFLHRAFRELNPRSTFLHNWHNELIASKLEACRRGEITRLIINIPPRSLKSHAAAVALESRLESFFDPSRDHESEADSRGYPTRRSCTARWAASWR